MTQSREESTLLSPDEKIELNEIVQVFKRADGDLINVQTRLNLLDQWMVKLQKLINPQSTVSHQSESTLLVQYLFGQGTAFHELTLCLGRLTRPDTNGAQQELLKQAANHYDEFLISDLKSRPLASTQHLADLFNLTKKCNEDCVRAIKIQLLQMELDNIVKELRSSTPLTIKFKSITELEILLAQFNQYIFNIEARTEKPVLSLLKFALLHDDKREHLLSSLTKLAQSKNVATQQELLAPYFQMQKYDLNLNAAMHLTAHERKELISVLQEHPDADSNQVIEQLYRLQLASSVEILKATSNLFLIQEELKTCFFIINAIQMHIFGKQGTEATNQYELFIKYLSLDDKTVVTKPLFAISRIADFLNAKSTQAAKEKLSELRKFEEMPIEINLHNLTREHIGLSRIQVSALIDLIKLFVVDSADFILTHTRDCIKLIHLAQTADNFKQLNHNYQVIIETLEFVNHLVDYAKLQKVFIKPSLEKSVKSISEKLNSLIEIHRELLSKTKEIASDQNKFTHKLAKLQEKQKKLIALRNNAIITLLEKNIFLTAFDNQLCLLNKHELQHHLNTLTPEKLRSITIESQLINLIQPFYRKWKEENKTVMTALKSTLPLFKMVNKNLPGILSKKVDPDDTTTRMPTDALKVVANSFSFSGSKHGYNVDGIITDIENMFNLNLLIEKRLKHLNLAKRRAKNSAPSETLENFKLVQHSLPLLLFKSLDTPQVVIDEPMRSRSVHSSADLEAFYAEKRFAYGVGRDKKHMRSHVNVFKVIEIHDPDDVDNLSDRKLSPTGTPGV